MNIEIPENIRQKSTPQLKTLRRNYKYDLEYGRFAYGPHRTCEAAQHLRDMLTLIEAELKYRGKNHRIGRP